MSEHALVLTGMAPAFGLPSWCPRTLEAQLLLQMSGARAVIVDSVYPYSAATAGTHLNSIQAAVPYFHH
jgi:hypothetical protein